MPEGDTIYRAATTLRRALLDRTVTGFESSVGEVAEMAGRNAVAGRTIAAVEPRGKHLLMALRADPPGDLVRTAERVNLDLREADLVLHTHLRMTGSWHIYRPGEAWRKPARYAVAVIHTDAFVAPCFSAPVVELLTARETARSRELSSLGPDAITEEFDAAEARARIRARGDLEISVALMDQHAMAGVGNVYKSEALFVRRVNPWARVRNLSDKELDGLITECHRLLTLNRERGNRRTVFRLGGHQRLWVYGREGAPCRVCGDTICCRKQGYDARITWYCPRCQGVSAFKGPS